MASSKYCSHLLRLVPVYLALLLWIQSALAETPTFSFDQLRYDRSSHVTLLKLPGPTIGYSTFQSHNRKVIANSHGIFLSRLTGSNSSYTNMYWEVLRSVDGGRSFEKILDGAERTTAPALATDRDENLYVMHTAFNGDALILRILAPEFSDFETVAVFPDGYSSKFTGMFDPFRKSFYYFDARWFRPFFTYSFNSNDYTVQSLFDCPGCYQSLVSYPHIELAPEGTLYLAWTNALYQCCTYWDIHAMKSPDGGLSWQKLDGTPLTMTVPNDEQGPTDRITTDDEFGKNPWLNGLRFRNGKLHFVYSCDDPFVNGKDYQRYVRIDAATGAREIDLPNLSPLPETGQYGNDGGFAFDRQHPRTPMYFCTAVDNRTRLGCFGSDDDGASWYLYAVSETKFVRGPYHGVYSVNVADDLSSNKDIVGSFTHLDPSAYTFYEPNSGETYFFRIKAGLARASVRAVLRQNQRTKIWFDSIQGQPTKIRFQTRDGLWGGWRPFQEYMDIHSPRAPIKFQLLSSLHVSGLPTRIDPT